MLKLIKYEFIKKSKLLFILLVIALLANLGLGLANGSGGLTIFLISCPIILTIIYLYELIRTYSDDMNKKTGYMLFMTPYSGYTIIASKLFTIILEGVIFIAAYFVFAIIDLSVMAYKNVGNFSFIMDGIKQIIEALNVLINGVMGINLGDLLLILLVLLASSVVFVLTVYTAITLRKSIFSNIKLGGVISFVIFIVINIIISRLSDIVENIFNFKDVIINISHNTVVTYPSSEMFQIFTIMIIFNCVIGAVLILGSGYLLEKKINL